MYKNTFYNCEIWTSTTAICPPDDFFFFFLVVQGENKFCKILSWNVGKTFLLQLYRNRQWIKQIYNVLASKLLPAVYLELTSSLSWRWRATWWWSNIFQDMVPAVQPIFLNKRTGFWFFFLNEGSKVYFSRYWESSWGRKSLNFLGSLGRACRTH